jgi:inorganic pyrophosphatase
MDQKVKVYIEIEKNSNFKYEYNHTNNELELDRILDKPHVYPYAYGFIINTIAKDLDELDALILTDKFIKNDEYYNVYIIGVLIMEDEKGLDEKVLCVLEEDYNKINDLNDIDQNIKNKIHYFFSNYKNNSDNRWSKVYNFKDKSSAIKLYNEYLQTEYLPKN